MLSRKRSEQENVIIMFMGKRRCVACFSLIFGSCFISFLGVCFESERHNKNHLKYVRTDPLLVLPPALAICGPIPTY